MSVIDNVDADIEDENLEETEDLEVEEPEVSDDHEGGDGGDDKPEGEDKPAKEPAKDEPKEEPKTVPLAAHIEERNKLKARISELESAQKQEGLSEEDRQLLAELRQLKSQQPATPAPDFAEDPKGYVDWLNNQHKQALEKLEKANQEASEQSKKTNEQLQHQARVNGVLNAVAQQEEAFTATTPDYNDALAHARNIRSNQLSMLFPEATTEQINQQIAAEEIQASERLLQQGKNPAEFAYNYAKTLGYQTKKPNGEAPRGKKPDREAVETLGSGGGGAPSADDDDDEDGGIISGLKAARKEAFGK